MWVVSLLKTEVQEEEELVWENGDVTVRYVGVEVAVGFSSILFYQDIIAYDKFTLSRVRFCSLTSACSHHHHIKVQNIPSPPHSPGPLPGCLWDFEG